jgi:predicted MFS family arabinose efflux permease
MGSRARRSFFAQAAATGFVSQAATADRGAASGIYLACYFAGGLVGTATLGQMFDRIGWPACVGGIALSLGLAALLTPWLKMTPGHYHSLSIRAR